MTDLRRLLLRPWRDSSFRILALALLVASVALSSVILVRAELDARFASRTAEVLGGDLVLKGSRPPEAAQAELLSERRTAVKATFSTVLVDKGQVLLVSAKAVSDAWPLYGEVDVAASRFATAAKRTDGPSPGEAWVADQVLDRLELEAGDSVRVGNLSLTITGVVKREPDQGTGFYNMNPRLLMHADDLPASGIIGPGTRYRHRTLIATDSADALENTLADTLRPDQELETVDNAALRSLGPLRQLTLWMSLAVLLVSLLCGAALYLATGVRTRRRARTVALLRTFGASQAHVARRLLVEECAGALPVILAGCLPGVLVAQGVRIAFDLEAGSAATAQHWLAMFAAPLLLFAGFVLPRIRALLNTPTLAVLNRNVQPAASTTTLALGAALLTPMALAALLTGSVTDSGLLVLALGVSGALLPLLAWPALAATSKLSHRIGSRYGMALRRLTRRPSLTLPLVSALTISLAVLTLAALSGQALLEQWRQQLPEKAPNFFVINLFDEDLEVLDAWQQRHQAQSEPLYPIVRGRLTLINDAPVREAVTKENDRAERALNRDLALTVNSEMPDSNRVSEGTWHGETPGEVSVEERLAEALQLAIGDRLSFVTSRGTVSATVTSIREVDWESFQPNFYFMFSPGAFADQDVTWMTSFWLPAGDGARLAELMQALPHITLLDVNAVLDKAQAVVSQASNAVIGLAGLLIAAALLVLAAALLASQQQRAGDQALLRALGASDALVRRIDLIEFCALAGMALLGALLLCALALTPLAVMLFSGDLPLSGWLALPLPAALLVIAVGMLGTRRARRTPALAILRQDS